MRIGPEFFRCGVAGRAQKLKKEAVAFWGRDSFFCFRALASAGEAQAVGEEDQTGGEEVFCKGADFEEFQADLFAGEDQRDFTAEGIFPMKETYRQADIKVLQQMISMGYDPSSVINDYEKISVFSEALKESGSSETAAAAYHNEVTAIVLAEAQKEGRAQQEKVMTMFRSLREANEQKYSETGKSEAFERFQDGQIVVAILRNHFPPFAAYYTLRDVAGYSKKTAFQMLQSAGIVKLLYADIQNSTIERQEECRNEMALYRYLAKERMMQSGLKTFDFEDDLAIARRMHERHLPRELIENAVRRVSPVMREIGRDAEKYWAAMAADVSSYKELPGNVTSYKTLFELGYTAAAVYKAVLGEHAGYRLRHRRQSL